jgi:hypothetical protein
MLSRVAHHAAVAEDEDPPAGAGTVLVPLEEADAGEDKVAVVADDDTERGKLARASASSPPETGLAFAPASLSCRVCCSGNTSELTHFNN